MFSAPELTLPASDAVADRRRDHWPQPAAHLLIDVASRSVASSMRSSGWTTNPAGNACCCRVPML